MTKSKRLICLLTAALLSLTGCTSDKEEAKANVDDAWPVVRVGYLPIAAELPLFVAVEEDFFADEGVAIVLERFTSSNDLGNAATADRIDLMAGTASNVIFDIGAISPIRHKLVALNIYSDTQGHITDHLLVGQKSQFEKILDLKERKVASFPGSVNRAFVRLVFEKHGLPWGSYEYIEMPPPNWQAALASGAVDAVSALEPAASQIIVDGVGRSIFPGLYADLMPDVPLSGHWFSEAFLGRADSAHIRSILRAYDRAIVFCQEEPGKAKAYLTEYANVRPDVLDSVNLNKWVSRGDVNLNSLQKYVDLLSVNDALQARVEVGEFMVDDRRDD